MQQHFMELAKFLTSQMRGDEVYTSYLTAEDSDFVRINHAQIRQPGSVSQANLQLRLLQGKRQCSVTVGLIGDLETDKAQLRSQLNDLRGLLPHLPEDPHLLINESVDSSEHIESNALPTTADMVDNILTESVGLDCVGILASGSNYRAFANSFGQRNWFSSHNFNWDWSLVHSVDKAVKSGYAGKEWDSNVFASKMTAAKAQLKLLARPSKTLKPGSVRVYLSPVALSEILDLLSWSGFGLASHKNKTTPLLGLLEGDQRLSPQFSLAEDVAGGVAPDFQSDGFLRPSKVSLIEDGRLSGALISPRSAKEFGAQTTGANGDESPDSLAVTCGDLPTADVLKALGTGVWIGNLWYLNYSDRAAGRMTGMTRFATFWVENGEIVAPLNVMRFDDTIHRMLGSELEALTVERELLLSASTYYNRSTGSSRLPGVLLKDFAFTL
jgi:predicted Zn-dependent protease